MTFHEWLKRYKTDGPAGQAPQPVRPAQVPVSSKDSSGKLDGFLVGLLIVAGGLLAMDGAGQRELDRQEEERQARAKAEAEELERKRQERMFRHRIARDSEGSSSLSLSLVASPRVSLEPAPARSPIEEIPRHSARLASDDLIALDFQITQALARIQEG